VCVCVFVSRSQDCVSLPGGGCLSQCVCPSQFQLTSDPAPLALSPGSGSNDFTFESNDLPGIGIMELQGDSPVMAFEDEGPSGEIGDQYFEVEKADFVPRHVAVPTVPVPQPFDAATILNDIRNHVQELVGMQLVEPTFASRLGRLLSAAREALRRNDTVSALSHLKEMQLLIKGEAGQQDNKEWDSEETASPTLLITQLAARVLLFDVGFVIGHL